MSLYEKLRSALPEFQSAIHISPRLRCVYIQNPKAACSTIKLALQRSELGDPEYVPRSIHNRGESPLLRPKDVHDLEAVLRDYFVFTFVREPAARLRSVHAEKLVGHPERQQFRRIAGLPEDARPDLATFVRAVCSQDPSAHDRHWRPQTINTAPGLITYDFIGRLERFTDDWRTVADRLGLPREPERRNSRPAQRRSEEMTDELRALVRRAYADDYETFGY